ncbi:unnamed protein product [Vitrella brassicaformis CCMP3155]|uniref:Bromo domain-containing protein n=2 Tax=Vitrella brassicaformis TaxID=1169539 RepID=A0A0G4F157_VITBC|nr:unnamed protein product [Vitrella brassicaformis CCMP3155]|eukprot:CEM05031.1 unnamed protein product [Vitrella brassicaformis CCMP3155]
MEVVGLPPKQECVQVSDEPPAPHSSAAADDVGGHPPHHPMPLASVPTPPLFSESVGERSPSPAAKADRPFALTAVHGLHCQRGTLQLSKSEYDALTAQLKRMGSPFVFQEVQLRPPGRQRTGATMSPLLGGLGMGKGQAVQGSQSAFSPSLGAGSVDDGGSMMGKRRRPRVQYAPEDEDESPASGSRRGGGRSRRGDIGIGGDQLILPGVTSRGVKRDMDDDAWKEPKVGGRKAAKGANRKRKGTAPALPAGMVELKSEIGPAGSVASPGGGALGYPWPYARQPPSHLVNGQVGAAAAAAADPGGMAMAAAPPLVALGDPTEWPAIGDKERPQRTVRTGPPMNGGDTVKCKDLWRDFVRHRDFEAFASAQYLCQLIGGRLDDFRKAADDPLDLNTVKIRLERGDYGEPREFAWDFLEALNCVHRFVPLDNQLWINAHDLHREFLKRFDDKFRGALAHERASGLQHGGSRSVISYRTTSQGEVKLSEAEIAACKNIMDSLSTEGRQELLNDFQEICTKQEVGTDDVEVSLQIETAPAQRQRLFFKRVMDAWDKTTKPEPSPKPVRQDAANAPPPRRGKRPARGRKDKNGKRLRLTESVLDSHNKKMSGSRRGRGDDDESSESSSSSDSDSSSSSGSSSGSKSGNESDSERSDSDEEYGDKRKGRGKGKGAGKGKGKGKTRS